MTTNESDIALDVDEVIVVDEDCEAGLGVSCQICGAGRCTT